ncbi:MAG: hypothetical protein CM1200mP40_05900 [Gammaproteobacteria bacterium]|jgi:hypothetical protein|nr:MAG: hypothetical protein CM1200mP40_05900 [Gammaproteobacteria bacterium]GIT63960.1 MAG: hypothetical protein Ct9H300mP22_3600 [Gammaproteobacteria bacterium]|tara:strand:- start:214 stop:798 length:585 start_codon:yes stop_codon:yes gene_type:complete
MPPAILGPYTRTILTAAIIAAALGFSFTYARLSVYTELMPFFEWMETTWFGYVGKTWGAAFATIQAGHLIGLAVLGGCVIVSDGRLLGVLLTDVPHRKVIDRADRVFFWALITLLATGVFMACGVAMKIYYLPVYWYKMLALGAGILFHYYVRRPLVAHEIESINPIILKMTAIASILVWFLVAATGRWIGFSG